MRLRAIILIVATLVSLGFVNVSIFQKEQLVANGQSVFLELAPVDPRSLIQGDYMVLDYAITRDQFNCDIPRRGQVLLTLDARGVAQQVRVADEAAVTKPNELRLRYHTVGCRVQIGAESFFFQEGQAGRYATARYAELKVADSGESVLVGLRGSALERLDLEPEIEVPATNRP